MGRMVGIDLGTTNTVVAVMDGPRPRVLDNREGKPQTRSVVGLKKRRTKKGDEGSEILVGEVALDNWPMAPCDTIISIKRLMGRAVNDAEVQKVRDTVLYDVVEPSTGTRDSVRVVMGGVQYSPIDISAMILKKVKEDAEYRLGEEVTHAVITVPAYFSQLQHDATRKAGLKAGLKVIKILDEPTAAAIAFGTDSSDGSAKTLLVYDLGGGTFDVSLLMLAGNVFAPLNLEGDMWLGGDNLDQVIVDYAIASIKEEYGIDPTTRTPRHLRFMAELKKAAQAAKERLSAGRSADLILTGLLQDERENLIDVTLEMTREEFERMILPLVGTYRQCGCGAPNFASSDACAKCGKLLKGAAVRDGRAVQIVRKALANQNQSAESVDHVLMAGNSSMIPLVQQSMEELFGPAKVLRKVHPKHSVALGAAIVAAWIGNRVVCQAPDPVDPKRECGHVNKPDAVKCEGCGASLELELPPAPVDSTEGPVIIFEGGGVGEVVSIAPYHYGTQSAGDKFNVFINKGDPYKTENPKTETFFTRSPNQRMLSIPVWGGDNLAKASANVRQGEAFALLPIGLPQDTAIRIKLWLDSDGIFDLAAYLEDGTNLHPWIVHGEADARAIDGIQKIERILATKGDSMDPRELRKLEAKREEIFDCMRRHEFDRALELVQELEKSAEEAVRTGGGGGDELTTKAENLVGYTMFVLNQYGWAFDDQGQVYKLTKLAEEVREALAEGDRATLERKVPELDKATDSLPDAIRVFIGIRGAIMTRIQPGDPGLAASLIEELENVESAFKARNPMAPHSLEALAIRVKEAIETTGAPTAGLRCSSCGNDVPPGEHLCPTCGDDIWIPTKGKGSSGQVTGSFRRR